MSKSTSDAETDGNEPAASECGGASVETRGRVGGSETSVESRGSDEDVSASVETRDSEGDETASVGLAVPSGFDGGGAVSVRVVEVGVRVGKGATSPPDGEDDSGGDSSRCGGVP